jgi:hypothetical protein
VTDDERKESEALVVTVLEETKALALKDKPVGVFVILFYDDQGYRRSAGRFSTEALHIMMQRALVEAYGDETKAAQVFAAMREAAGAVKH